MAQRYIAATLGI